MVENVGGKCIVRAIKRVNWASDADEMMFVNFLKINVSVVDVYVLVWVGWIFGSPGICEWAGSVRHFGNL